ncbi:hypothetical protein KJ885_05235 [Patescibacteria group bacterium]|nr:hypothetical protein [Patescibacteria group bacterium]
MTTHTNIYFAPIKNIVIPRSKKILPDQEKENKIKGLFAESLLLGDRITIEVNGPNLVIVTLLRWLGRNNLERLIEEGVIKFVYNPSAIAYITLENIRAIPMHNTNPGLNRITSPDPAWQDIFSGTSIVLGEQTGLPRADRRNIARLVGKKALIEIEQDKIFDEICKVSKIDFCGIIGKKLGFLNVDNPDSGDIPQDMMHKYLDVAGSNSLLTVACATGCNEIVGDKTSDLILEHRLSKILQPAGEKIENFNQILEFHETINIAELLDQGKISFNDILEMRTSKGANEFRQWLSNTGDLTPATLLREYNERWNGLLKITKNTSFKAGKIIFYTGIGAAVCVLSPFVGIGTGLGLNILDSFFLENIVKKIWRPKIFIDQLKEKF